MRYAIAEIVGLFVIVGGCVGLVTSAALVSAALAVALGSLLVILGGTLAVYAASTLEAAAKAEAAKARQ